jgi:hypothetical protein
MTNNGGTSKTGDLDSIVNGAFYGTEKKCALLLIRMDPCPKTSDFPFA